MPKKIKQKKQSVVTVVLSDVELEQWRSAAKRFGHDSMAAFVRHMVRSAIVTIDPAKVAS